jgi:DNA-binding transcriptional ArsR family regulator
MLYEYQSVFKAVADATRARILKMLTHGELCVCQIVAVLGLSQSTVSKHLWVLKTARLIQDRKDGRWVFYSLAQNSRNEYVQFILSNLDLWLKEDEVVIEDLKRVEIVKKIPLEEARECSSKILRGLSCEKIKINEGEAKL